MDGTPLLGGRMADRDGSMTEHLQQRLSSAAALVRHWWATTTSPNYLTSSTSRRVMWKWTFPVFTVFLSAFDLSAGNVQALLSDSIAGTVVSLLVIKVSAATLLRDVVIALIIGVAVCYQAARGIPGMVEYLVRVSAFLSS